MNLTGFSPAQKFTLAVLALFLLKTRHTLNVWDIDQWRNVVRPPVTYTKLLAIIRFSSTRDLNSYKCSEYIPLAVELKNEVNQQEMLESKFDVYHVLNRHIFN